MKTRFILITGDCFINGAHAAAGTVHELPSDDAATAVSSSRACYCEAPAPKPVAPAPVAEEPASPAPVIETAEAPASAETAAMPRAKKRR